MRSASFCLRSSFTQAPKVKKHSDNPLLDSTDDIDGDTTSKLFSGGK
jgi:hypothetical protein